MSRKGGGGSYEVSLTLLIPSVAVRQRAAFGQPSVIYSLGVKGEARGGLARRIGGRTRGGAPFRSVAFPLENDSAEIRRVPKFATVSFSCLVVLGSSAASLTPPHCCRAHSCVRHCHARRLVAATERVQLPPPLPFGSHACPCQLNSLHGEPAEHPLPPVR